MSASCAFGCASDAAHRVQTTWDEAPTPQVALQDDETRGRSAPAASDRESPRESGGPRASTEEERDADHDAETLRRELHDLRGAARESGKAADVAELRRVERDLERTSRALSAAR